MNEVEKRLHVVFFKTDQGSEPVREWLLSLPKADRKIVGSDVLKVQYCWPIGKPLVENLRNGLWEVRSSLPNRMARVIFCVDGGTMVLLHGFIKKTRTTPKQDIGLAIARMARLK